MKNWREDAQPEWPEAAPPTRDIPVVGAGSRQYRSLLDVLPQSGSSGTSNASNSLSENERSSDLRDPWGEEPGGAEAKANDPGEVTVQLDPLKKGRADGPDAASDVPVFVDESGRRGRTFRRIGILVGTACGAYAVVIVATLLSGNAVAPWLPVPVPGKADDKPAAGKVDDSETPEDSATSRPGAPGGVLPGGAGITASTPGAVPGKPGVSAAPGASGSAAPSGGPSGATPPSASGSARPSAGPTASAPSTPRPSTPVVPPPASSPPPAPSSPAASPSADSSPSPAGGASNTVADGPPEPAPAASSPAA